MTSTPEPPKPSLTDPPTDTAAPPVTEAGQTGEPKKRRFWPFGPRGEQPPKRPLLIRLFGLGIWGLIKLVALCVLVGFVVLALEFNPASPEFGARQAAAAFWRNAIAAGSWAIQNFWKPALAGAAVVLPIWVIWRLISLPFRR